jgi:hypothetical protein
MQKHRKTKHHPIFTGIHIGAVAIMALGMFGVSEVTKFEVHQTKLAKDHENGEVTEDSADGKKTLRMPVRYSDGLRETTISGM